MEKELGSETTGETKVMDDDAGGPQPDQVNSLFAEFDVDGSGSIDAQEFQQLAYACGEALDDDAAAAVCAALDKDENGTIDLAEFRAWLEGFDGAPATDPVAMARSALLRAKVGYLFCSLSSVSFHLFFSLTLLLFSHDHNAHR